MARKWKIGLAVSGGADSTALAVLMAALQCEGDFEAVVLHVDHALRPDSAADARFVRALARRLGLPCHATRVRVVRRRGESLEMAARRVRLAFFARMTAKCRLDAIATGHHADDVAETFLMRLARGAGAEGLAGLKRVSHVAGITFIRPLLDLRDRELKAFLTARRIPWREDATNRDTAILRNKVRHEILPWLTENFDPRMTEHIVKTAAILRGEMERPCAAPASEIAAKKGQAKPVPAPAFTLLIAPDRGFQRRREVMGAFPAVGYFSRRALAGRHLAVRTWQAGDRLSPFGLGGRSRKLQDIFVTAKLPVAARHTLPLVVDGRTNEVLWVPGYRVAQSVAVASPEDPSWRFTLAHDFSCLKRAFLA